MADTLCEKCAAYADGCDMLPAPGELLLAAVSGGADSVCLLLILRQLAQTRGFRLACAHYDHRLRAEESARDAAFVRALCEKLDVPFYLGSGDVSAAAKQMGRGIEETARAMRYAFLRETARELGAVRLATAHNADDNAETVLLFLARGAGSRGLAGIAPRRGALVRPLLFAERREIEAYLTERQAAWVEDSSNFQTDYARNRVRLGAMPALRSVNGAFAAHVLEAGERLRADEEYLSSLAARFLREHAAETPDGLCLPAGETAALPEPVFCRALREICGSALQACHVRAVRALLGSDGETRSADLPGLRVTRSFDGLYFLPHGDAASLPERPLPPDGETELPEAGLLLRRTDGVTCPETGPVRDGFRTLYFTAPLPDAPLTVRQRHEGDRLRLWGRGCTKSLKKLFAEAQIPAFRRARTPVLACGDEVMAVPGLGAAENRLARPGEAAVRIEIRKL